MYTYTSIGKDTSDRQTRKGVNAGGMLVRRGTET